MQDTKKTHWINWLNWLYSVFLFSFIQKIAHIWVCLFWVLRFVHYLSFNIVDFFYLHSRHQSHINHRTFAARKKRYNTPLLFSFKLRSNLPNKQKKEELTKENPNINKQKERENNFGPSSSAVLSCLLTFICFCYTHTVSTEKWKTLTKLYFILIMV